MIKVLFVCLGNICRSPLAEAIFKRKVSEKGLNRKIHVDSAGTSNFHIGQLADARSRGSATKNNLEIVHRARQIIADDLAAFDYILAMDRKNYQDILQLSSSPEQHKKVFLMRSFSEGKFDPDGEEADVPDPYYGGEEGFEKVYKILNECCDNFLTFLMDQHVEHL